MVFFMTMFHIVVALRILGVMQRLFIERYLKIWLQQLVNKLQLWFLQSQKLRELKLPAKVLLKQLLLQAFASQHLGLAGRGSKTARLTRP